MVGSYKRKSSLQYWEEVAMQRAIDAVNKGKMGWLRAAKTFNVPHATLCRRAKNENKFFNGVNKELGRFNPTFDEALEHEHVNYLKLLETRLLGLTCIEV
ncbi:hypothetical protein PR048_028410 [Dryococelus australis]|uniref:HTH psq-type domain-containing protein n=1 Tax=Dryococelus australis TaxID=614101 RepID=A0ABQ9GAH0_9NEOP|nr:hypothetical protein PR048_028410 [Dryococelus australis]